MDFGAVSREIVDILARLPKSWDGRASILAMRDSAYTHWKQMEWIGFFFQYLCERNLVPPFMIPGPRYGNVSFDGMYKIPWDFKAHAKSTKNHSIIVNDSEAIALGIEEYGCVGLVLASGDVVYDDDIRSFQMWHSQLKGGLSDYEIDRERRGTWSRRRKVSFELQQISCIRITDETMVKCGTFQQDFRNSNGRPRRKKMLLDIRDLGEGSVTFCI